MISTLVVFGLIMGAVLIMVMGLVFAFSGIVLMNTGRAESYDRAARKMARATNASKAEKKAAKAAKKAEKAAEKEL